jgi:hypothetical protein
MDPVNFLTIAAKLVGKKVWFDALRLLSIHQHSELQNR